MWNGRGVDCSAESTTAKRPAGSRIGEYFGDVEALLIVHGGYQAIELEICQPRLTSLQRTMNLFDFA